MEISEKNFSTILALITYGVFLLFADWLFAVNPLASSVFFTMATTALFYSMIYIRQWSIIRILVKIVMFLKKEKPSPDYIKQLSSILKVEAVEKGWPIAEGWEYTLWVKKNFKFLGLKIYRWRVGATHIRPESSPYTYAEIQRMLMDSYLADNEYQSKSKEYSDPVFSDPFK
jgi:hypothetical protein